MIKKEFIRNFCIIAHIDHGKSTLCDRLLELTGQIKLGQSVERVLDVNPISRERGITIKLAPVTMNYFLGQNNHQLNMIDTPGHVDFSYEVSRSLAACEGAVLLVDATQGIQAQTYFYWKKAKKEGLKIVPVINKIDLSTAQPNKVKKSIIKNFAFKEDEIITISAKTGKGVEQLLNKLIKEIPPPFQAEDEKPLQALVFDSFYHPFKGVIVYLRVIQGKIDIANINQLRFIASEANVRGLEIGIFKPALTKIKSLLSGEVGYLATGLKDISKAQVGDTIISIDQPASALPGYKMPQSVVFLDLFPIDVKKFEGLKEGLLKLKLNDASLSFKSVFSEALGKGFRCGFLGLLHAEIVQERLEREFFLSLVATQASVLYLLEEGDGKKVYINSASQVPAGKIDILEPIVKATIFTPETYLGNIFSLCENKRGRFIDMERFGLQIKIIYHIPLSEIIVDFFDKLKASSSGFASFDYEFLGFEKLKAVRLDIKIHGQLISALSQIVPAENAYLVGKNLARRLKDVLPRQLFEFAVQAAIAGKIIASEKVKAYRKDVTAKLYGGDQTRKDKLLKKQVKGKKRLKKIGKISLPQEAFLAVLKRD